MARSPDGHLLATMVSVGQPLPISSASWSSGNRGSGLGSTSTHAGGGVIVYAVRRFINYLILTMLATVLGYILATLTLNPSARFYGRNPRPSDATIEHSLQQLGVDPNVPVLQRTWDWISGIFLHGTFGLENNLDPVGHDMLVRSL